MKIFRKNFALMAKRKNHSNKNQNRKHHRNSIKRPPKHKLIDTPGVNDKLLKNLYYSRLGNKRVLEGDSE